ncbi:50S ribosomal protein L3 [Streptobacillus moniliformis]|uniref:Large ribosomal subunit protein uL3 n=1 Tax=Streptobacillus moniliformis (strain ATCC 14647 / DSM 12112 / NCTC 10651 / 9901) TaxID=519441 RepID=D1AWK3_STRM9|nr:50S ribosomal protein L3 [Streptobacillus moniliformis]ACZ00679.1 ribosomal protein L3 [Streptobacillus moniliformis DSM 12112]AVL42921.1 50S ribosomal protein L3 [Streptobacillus moniliformis]SQA14194.1 50S ribosomal protein L3 [Streptobacillus moniliformis]SQA14392.1 50S ribosomal protein L3 [Streptobacillus moniliformis]
MILGKKIGMTQIFENEKLIPVTVIEAGPNFVVQTKTVEKEGYTSITLAYDEKREKLVNKPEMGVFKKAGITAKKFLKEFKVESVEEFALGQELKVDVLEGIEFVDIQGISKGKGTAGVMKRHNFGGNRATHGVSRNHRLGGSNAGGAASNSNVPKGKKMAGRLGNENVTVQNLKVVKFDVENNLLLVKGAVPGPKNGYLVIKKSIKKY